jgi:hypothetical protein
MARRRHDIDSKSGIATLFGQPEQQIAAAQQQEPTNRAEGNGRHVRRS